MTSYPAPVLHTELKRKQRAAMVRDIAARCSAAIKEDSLSIDWTRLADLRSRAAATRESYLAMTARAQSAMTEVAALRRAAMPATESQAARAFLHQPVEVLAALSPEDIAAAGFDARDVRRLVSALYTAARFRIEAGALAAKVRENAALINNLNAYVNRFE